MSKFKPSPKISAALFTLMTFVGIVICSGCEQSQTPSATPAEADPTDGGPLGDILVLAEAGDTEAAIRRFVHDAPTNWLESASLEEFQISEADFQKLDRSESSRLHAKLIERVGDIKGFARTVVDKASEAKKKGDTETAEKYMESVNRLGRQLRDGDLVLVFQHTGKALANATLED